jgi:spore germination protein KC
MKKTLLIPLILMLTGCWNYYELNNLALTTGMAIDKKDNKYEVTYLISNAKKNEVSSKEGEAGTTTYSGIGDTIQEAINDLKIKMPFEPYNGHLVITIISETIAKEGLENILDLLARDTESRNFFYILLSKNTEAKDILEIISPLQTLPSQTIASDIETSSEESSLIYKITYNDLIYTILEQGINPVLNSVTIIGNKEQGTDTKELSDTIPKATIKIDTLGIFKDDKLIDWANTNESIGINLLTNKINKLDIKTKCKDKYMMNHIENLKVKTNIDLDNNKAKIKITGQATILETNCKINLKDKETIEKIEKDIEQEIKKIIDETSYLIQKKYTTDVLGYGKIIHKKNPKKYKQIKNWDDTFKNIKIEPKIEIKIKNQGSLIQTIKEVK